MPASDDRLRVLTCARKVRWVVLQSIRVARQRGGENAQSDKEQLRRAT